MEVTEKDMVAVDPLIDEGKRFFVVTFKKRLTAAEFKKLI